MMRCKLFSFNVVCLALYYCCVQFPVVLCASMDGHANSSTASCNSMPCANLPNISYPFWGSASCAASPSYVLSNCDSSIDEAYWDSFSDVANGALVSPPAVMAVTIVDVAPDDLDIRNESGVPQKSIQLTWNKTFIGLDYRAPLFSSTNLSFYNIPSSINLTRFPDSSALEFSPNNTYLLFNCTHITSDDVAQFGSQILQAESAIGCKHHKGDNTPCIQWSVPPSMKELMLQHVLDTLACSHFMFGIASHDEWSPGSIELIWTDVQCKKCQSASGFCMYNVTFPGKFDYCLCNSGLPLDEERLDTTCCLTCPFAIDDCHGGIFELCNTGGMIAWGVSCAILVIGIFVIIRFKRNCVNLCGMIRQSMRVGFLSFIKVTIPIAINVLKKTVRKLQSVSIGRHIVIDFDGLTERPMEYSYSSIASATKSFSSLVGEGGFGKVYKGTLTPARSHGGSELQIAVKVLETRSKHSKKQFLNEVVTIGRIHHVNVVRMVGFFMQEDHEMLVYEYVVNGSLDRWLFDRKGEAQKQVLDWGQRYAIALGIARGLTYLHEECRHRTVHCDIKPQNILLDEDMHPKIADFGLARLMDRDESKVVTFAKGTPGYMAPEFWMVGESQLSTKFDVYSYGMVLLELISGQRNFRHDAAASHVSSFPAVAFKAAMEGDLESILDARLGITIDGHVDEAGKRAQWQQIKTAVFVALWCIQEQAARRPSMSEVLKYLEGGAAVSESPPQPNISNIFAPPYEMFAPPSISPPQESTPLSVGR